MKIFRYAIVVIALSCLTASSVFASDWGFTYRNLAQVRKDISPSRSVPIYQYFGYNLSGLPKNIDFQTDFRAYLNPELSDGQMDLYQATLHIEPAEDLNLNVGRLWTVDGFETGPVDGFKVGFFPSDFIVGGSFYAGVPRYLEETNFTNIPNGLLVGFNLNLQEVKNTTLQFSTRWKKINVTSNSWNRNDTISAGLTGSHQFDNSWSPNIYGDVEYDIAGKVFDDGTLGIDLFPHWRVALTFEGNRFNVNRKLDQPTILGNYFTGGIWQGRQALELKLRKNLHFIEDFSYQRYDVQGRGGENAYTASAGLDYYWEALKLSALATYYLRKSFGGQVQGGYFEVNNKYFKKWIFEAHVDVSHYSKITKQTSTAVSLIGDVCYMFNNYFKLALGGEFNRNNWFSRDGRITINAAIDFDKATFHPKKHERKSENES